MKIMTQDKTRVLNFKMTYISYVSKNRICEGDLGIAEYASPERAKEVLNDMFQKYAAGEKRISCRRNNHWIMKRN